MRRLGARRNAPPHSAARRPRSPPRAARSWSFSSAGGRFADDQRADRAARPAVVSTLRLKPPIRVALRAASSSAPTGCRHQPVDLGLHQAARPRPPTRSWSAPTARNSAALAARVEPAAGAVAEAALDRGSPRSGATNSRRPAPRSAPRRSPGRCRCAPAAAARATTAGLAGLGHVDDAPPSAPRWRPMPRGDAAPAAAAARPAAEVACAPARSAVCGVDVAGQDQHGVVGPEGRAGAWRADRRGRSRGSDAGVPPAGWP